MFEKSLSCAPFQYSLFGEGDKLCVYFSPVQAQFDHGASCLSLIGFLLGKGYRVLVIDTLSLHNLQAMTFSDLVHSWNNALHFIGSIDLIAGDALGAAVAQALLGLDVGGKAKQALILSGATVADQQLKDRLGCLADLARAGYVEQSNLLLMQMVAPENPQRMYVVSPPASVKDETLAAIRLSCGYDFFNALDIRDTVRGYKGALLSLYGAESRLVREVNVDIGDAPSHHKVGIPHCGMRPLSDGLTDLVRNALIYLHI